MTSVARAENTAQGFWPPTPKQQSWSVMSWMLPAEGRAPVIAEPVQAQVRLNVPGPAVVYALSPAGNRRDRLNTTAERGAVLMNPATARSVWCEIVLQE